MVISLSKMEKSSEGTDLRENSGEFYSEYINIRILATQRICLQA